MYKSPATTSRVPARKIESIPKGCGGPHSAQRSLGQHDDPLQFLMATFRQYGDIAKYQSAFGPVFLVSHPEYVKDVLQSTNYVRTSLVKMALGEGLLTSDGELGRRQRNLMYPFFHRDRIAPFSSLIAETTNAAIERWKDLADSNQQLNISDEMTRLTLDVAVKALFSVDLKEEADALGSAITTIMVALGHTAWSLFNCELSVHPSRQERLREALDTIDRTVYDMIDQRRRQRDKPPDLLSLLILARDDTSGEGLSDQQLRDEVVTMLISGHETTALILSWSWYLLANDPFAERRLFDEVSRIPNSQFPTAAHLPGLAFTQQVLQETMRLFPPVWFIVRKTLEDDELAGQHIPAETTVVVSPYVVHRHPRYWQKADEFVPDRFSPGMANGRPQYAYFPFLGGRHTCLGQQFAMLEGTIALAMLARAFRVNLAPGFKVQPQPVLTLRQRDGLLTTLESRSSAKP